MPPESSTELETGANAPVETKTPDVNSPGESSASGSGVETPTLLQSVEAALNKSGKEASPASENGNEKDKTGAQKPEDAAEGDEDLKSDITEEEISKFSPRSQRRIRQLLAQRDDGFQERDSLRPRADNWDRVTAYMREHSIAPDELDNTIAITGLINSRQYDKALAALTPIYRELAQKAGELLPEDLKEKVRLGHISEPDARDLNKQRAAASAAAERETRNTERATADNERSATQAQINNATKAVDDWAKAKAGSDPDWNLKQKDVADQVKLRILEGGLPKYPKTNEEAVAIAEDALKVVEERYKLLRPKPKPIQSPATGQFVSPHSKAVPKSLSEAIDQALGG